MLRAGEILGVPFGTPEEEAMRRLTQILGPSSEPENTNIGGGTGNYRNFGSLTVLSFETTLSAGGLALHGWLISEPDGAWITDTGISIGSTEAAVLTAFPTATVTSNDECGNAPYITTGEIEFSLDPSQQTVDGIGSPTFGFC